MKKEVKQEVSVIDNEFKAVSEELQNIMSQELDGLNIRFDRVKVPSGGALYFELPGEDSDNPDTIKELKGVILHHHALNSYYTEKYTGGNSAPDCGSIDGKTGEGEPGGECAKCPLNQFGSGENGTGKACKNKRRIYLLREGEIFPIILTLPTGSLKEFTNYIAKRIVGKGKRSFEVLTKITLKKAVNSGGITYSQAVFSVDRVLSKSEVEIMSDLSEKMKETTKYVTFEFDEELDNETAPFEN